MRFAWVILICCGLALGGGKAQAGGARIKDLTMVKDARDNQISGLGLVVGLAGDGDKDQIYSVQVVANMLQRFGINVPASTLSAKNIAVVVVTADIHAFMKAGSRLDVTVAAMGDARSLQGGVLLQTPLYGNSSSTIAYAVAQGAISVGGFVGGASGGGGATVQKNHPTVGQIPGGAIVEQEIETEMLHNRALDLILRDPDFASASRMAEAVNQVFPGSSTAVDPTMVHVLMPENLAASPVDFIARVQAIETTPDTPARVIINERTGTIVATSRIRISACAVSHGELTISIASSLDVSQPAPFSKTGTTTTTPRTDTKVSEAKASLIALPEMPTIEKVASGLNAMGVTPRDMMAIFQAMKQAGALQAELILE